MDIGRRIRELREQRGWSQALNLAQELAARLTVADPEPALQRYIVERLGVRVVLSETDGQRVAALSCLIGAVHCAAVHSWPAVQSTA